MFLLFLPPVEHLLSGPPGERDVWFPGAGIHLKSAWRRGARFAQPTGAGAPVLASAVSWGGSATGSAGGSAPQPRSAIPARVTLQNRLRHMYLPPLSGRAVYTEAP